MCPRYIEGLIGPGNRKSVQSMEERLAPGLYDELHHVVAGGVWQHTGITSYVAQDFPSHGPPSSRHLPKLNPSRDEYIAQVAFSARPACSLSWQRFHDCSTGIPKASFHLGKPIV